MWLASVTVVVATPWQTLKYGIGMIEIVSFYLGLSRLIKWSFEVGRSWFERADVAKNNPGYRQSPEEEEEEEEQEDKEEKEEEKQ